MKHFLGKAPRARCLLQPNESEKSKRIDAIIKANLFRVHVFLSTHHSRSERRKGDFDVIISLDGRARISHGS
jgi:hypothetical protein